MRAGQLDREITIQRATSALDQYRTPVDTWAPIATLRAALFTASMAEVIAGFGAEAQDVIVFETRWFEGIRVADRIVYNGVEHDIKAVTEIGRRRGLQLRAISRRSADIDTKSDENGASLDFSDPDNSGYAPDV